VSPTVFVDTDASADTSSQQRPTVFVDRDGTLNVDQVHGVSIEGLELRPGAAQAMRAWRDAGWRIVVITNQSGIARGKYTELEMHRFHEALQASLGVTFDALYFCPHLPDAGCACRKPAPGMLLQAAREHGIDLRASFMVGDSWLDVEAAEAVGARSVLVPSKPDTLSKRAKRPDHVAEDLAAAAEWMLSQSPAAR